MQTLLKLKEAIQLGKKSLIEYDMELTKTDYAESDAMIVPVNGMLINSKGLPNIQPFTLGVVKKNLHLDFLIFVNITRYSNVSNDEKLTILAHEALHIVEQINNSQPSSFKSIEVEAKKLVFAFKKLAE